MSRRHCLTERVATDFGTLYAQLDIDEHGGVIGLNIAAHSKHADTSVDRALRDISQAFRDMLDNLHAPAE